MDEAEYFGEKHSIAMETEQRKLTVRYDELKQKVDTLKSQFEQVHIYCTHIMGFTKRVIVARLNWGA